MKQKVIEAQREVILTNIPMVEIKGNQCFLCDYRAVTLSTNNCESLSIKGGNLVMRKYSTRQRES